jgi:hypothetical protein
MPTAQKHLHRKPEDVVDEVARTTEQAQQTFRTLLDQASEMNRSLFGTWLTSGEILAANAGLLARWLVAGQASLLEGWPRVAEGLTRAALQTQEAVLGASLQVTSAGPRLDGSQSQAWIEAIQPVQLAALELWQVLASAGQRAAQVSATELRYTAAELLEQLAAAERQRQQLERERDRLREQVERERAERQRAEHAREQERTRAKEEHAARQRAEQAAARLERELERADARAQQARETVGTSGAEVAVPPQEAGVTPGAPE